MELADFARDGGSRMQASTEYRSLFLLFLQQVPQEEGLLRAIREISNAQFRHIDAFPCFWGIVLGWRMNF